MEKHSGYAMLTNETNPGNINHYVKYGNPYISPHKV